MDTFEHIIFQLIVHVYSASLNQEPSLVFGKEKGTVAFHFPIRPEGYDTILFYRPLGEDNKLLMTVTGEDTISHSERVFYRVSKVTGTFLVTLKSLFDSGTYIAETWREKHLITKHIYCVKICSKYQHISHGIKRYQGNEVYETKDFKIDVSFFDPNLRETLKIYKKVEPQELLVGSLTIGPDVCSQISPSEQMSGMQVLHQGSSVWFSNVSAEQDIGQYYIIIRKGTDCCQELITIEIEAFFDFDFSYDMPQRYWPRIPVYPVKVIFVWANRIVTLSCAHRESGLIRQAEKPKGNVVWETPAKILSVDPDINIIYSGQSPPKEEMYIERETYSLVIPSVKPKDSGDYYKCMEKSQSGDVFSEDSSTSMYELVVCPAPETTYVMFSLNGTVTLTCDTDLTARPITQWYRQRGDEEEHLILKNWFNWDVSARVDLPSDMRDRVDTCHPHNTLVISNLSPNDSGVYQCMRGGHGLACYSRKFHLAYRHPYGAHSPFYRVYTSILGTGLMVTICAVAYASLKNRKARICQRTHEDQGESPGQSEREGEQSGDDTSI